MILDRLNGGLFLGKSIDEMVEILTVNLLHFAENRIPSKTITVNDRECPWVTPEVRAAINRNKRVYKKWVKRGRDMEGKR